MAKKEKQNLDEDQKIPATVTRNLYQKLQLIQEKTKELIRSEENKSQKWFYFDELQVLQLLKPLLAEQKLTILLSDDETKEFICQPVEASKMWLVKYGKRCEIFNATNPEQKLTYFFWATALNQDPAKAKGSAETHAVKFFLSKLFLMPVKDEEDPDSYPKETNDHKVFAKEEKTLSPKKSDFQPQVTATLLNIKAKSDKNDSNYLLLETDKLDNNIFVFPYRLPEERWAELKVGTTYHFLLEESAKGLLVLQEFEVPN